MTRQSPTSRTIDASIQAGPMPLLRSLGYHKSGRSFWLEVNGIYRIVNFQAGSQNTPEEASFTIKLQVTFPCFHEVYVASPFPKNPANAAMVVQTRMGYLLPPRTDRLVGRNQATQYQRLWAGRLSDC